MEMDEKISAILKLIGFQHAEDPSRIKEDLIKHAGESKESVAIALVAKLDITKVNDAIKSVVETLFTPAELDEAYKIANTSVVKKARIAAASIHKAVQDAIAKEATKLMSTMPSSLSSSSEPWKEIFSKSSGEIAGKIGGTKREPPSGLKPNDDVTLGRHRIDHEGDEPNWRPSMDKFVGRDTTIQRIVGFDPQGFEVATVAADDGRHMWRTRDMVAKSKVSDKN